MVGNIQRAAALFLVKNIFTILLVLTALLTPLVYPFQPVTLTVINALTVGIPSLVLALEPNRERIRGRFLTAAMEQALPAGLAAFLVLALAQLFAFSDRALATVSAAALAAVGLAVLVKVSYPLSPLRKAVVVAVAVALVGAFALLGPIFAVYISDGYVAMLMALFALAGVFLLWAISAVITWLKSLHLRRKKL